ncbi:GDCCVxC domain-containing (seleno)protein [uncultured Roseibium sp.]|uniref:GDCCVxC domain-containing (seleno)protein n=1 Tax=uncultured Roseibium sp. TaxID=1936171 RepID=UPI00260B2B24|nr:GDCCVxC domain-containing (seleno)protein [uncultured Roseibium sp.]
MDKTNIKLQSTITCPECGHKAEEIMPTDACQWFYECRSCGAILKPQPGDCCVYCSYGTVACPPIQEGDSCCG